MRCAPWLLPSPVPTLSAHPLPCLAPPRWQILLHAVASLKGGSPGHYRGCSVDDLLGLLRGDERRVYIVLHNIDGPGACRCWLLVVLSSPAALRLSELSLLRLLEQAGGCDWACPPGAALSPCPLAGASRPSSPSLLPQACETARRSSSCRSWRRCPTATWRPAWTMPMPRCCGTSRCGGGQGWARMGCCCAANALHGAAAAAACGVAQRGVCCHACTATTVRCAVYPRPIATAACPADVECRRETGLGGCGTT